MAQAALLSSLVEKSNSTDRDLRYMAANDLHTELQTDARWEGDCEKRACQARATRRHARARNSRLLQLVLKQMEDTASEVQGQAVKWCAAGCLPAPLSVRSPQG